MLGFTLGAQGMWSRLEIVQKKQFLFPQVAITFCESGTFQLLINPEYYKYSYGDSYQTKIK